jgi:Na+-transporting NADH:ubiquinone oxidoreductase subunit NqrC
MFFKTVLSLTTILTCHVYLLRRSQAEHKEQDLQTEILAHQQVITRNRLHRDALVETLSAAEETHRRTFATTEELQRGRVPS